MANLRCSNTIIEQPTIRFSVTGANPLTMRPPVQRSGVNAESAFTYTGKNEGLDRIEVVAAAEVQPDPEPEPDPEPDPDPDPDPDPPIPNRVAALSVVPVTSSAVTRHLWRTGLGLILKPDQTSGYVGTTFTVAAKVTDDGAAANGADVVFKRLVNGREIDQFSVLDAPGHAEWTYTGSSPGTESITATATYLERQASAPAITRTWLARPSDCPTTSATLSPTPSGVPSAGSTCPPIPPVETPPTEEEPEVGRLALSPNGTSTTIGGDFTAVARWVDDQGDPVAGVLVTFVAVQRGSPDIEKSVSTDEAGRAELTYARQTPGADRVLASVDQGGSTIKVAIDHRWVSPNEGPLTCRQATPVSVTSLGDVAFLCGGCPPSTGVSVDVGGKTLEAPDVSAASSDDEVGVKASLPTLPPGTHEASLECGNRSVTVEFGVVSSTLSSANTGGAAGAAGAVLLFFLLVGWLLLPRGWISRRGEQ
ncbi:hypothetical protein [Nocardioides guangzhouensis]|uniref:hypothetical protein n=1 Tax=Nocardioides guangzhouensis TaxID=2497878 RepID=UPI00143845B0|nr:hypothetical protein [Nocardioides guangzhouensis]